MLVTDLAELLQRLYFGGDVSDDSSLIDIDFQQAIQSARAYKIKVDYWTGMKMEGERYINQTWLEPFENVPVSVNEKTGNYFSVLPQQVFGDLPKSRGMQLICPMQSPETSFMPMSYGEVWLFTNLPQDETVYYSFDTNNVYYYRMDNTIKNVFMQYVPLTSKFIPDEVVHEIRELVLNQFIKAKTPMDKLNQGNPNIVEEGVKP